eukprot:8417161-Pyramimonas_sp.AAC.1
MWFVGGSTAARGPSGERTLRSCAMSRSSSSSPRSRNTFFWKVTHRHRMKQLVCDPTDDGERALDK